MRNLFVKSICFSLVMAMVNNIAIAQTKPAAKKPAAKKPITTANPFGTAPTNNKFGAPPPNNNKVKAGAAATNANPFESSSTANPFENSNASKSNNKVDTSKRPSGRTNAPLVVIASSGNNPLTDSSRPSLRNDNIVEANPVKDRAPLVYDYIREDDAVYKQRIWRIIDAREKANLAFKTPFEGDNGSELFFAILYRAIMDSTSHITAFEDERFTTPFSKEKFKARFSGGLDTVPVYGDLNNPELITSREVRSKEFPVDSVYRFQIKEEVVFDKEASRLVTRILGVAPMGPQILPNGKVLDGPPITYFWIYYPDMRGVLAKYDVYNPKNYGNRMTWEDLFESRFYSSYIVKSTLDNPFNQSLADKHSKNKLFMLLEGEAIKEKIFNYEQDLWSY